MNYPYPLPNSIPTFVGPYFQVGNECCNGGMTNDIDAITKVMIDYTNQLPAGVTVSSIIYEITPPQDQMLILTNKVLTSPTATFMVSNGGIGHTYSVEMLATLSDGQIWSDHITVSVTDCDAGIGSGLLFAYSAITIANTLYYNAYAGQTTFPLVIPDEFGRTGTLVNSNALVYVDGLRKEPVDDYTVNVGHNTIVFMNALSVGAEVTFDLVAPPPPPPVWPAPVLLTGGVIATSLYYFAMSNQTVFSLGVPDRFGHMGSIATATGNALVYVDGLRQEPVSDYTINTGANTITFNVPPSPGAEVDFDLVTSPPPTPIIPPPILLNSGIISSSLYYIALSGQTVFNLGTPDEFNNIGGLTADGARVYRSGNRLTLTDGYTFNVTSNTVTLTYPAGDGEPIIIEFIAPNPPPPPPPIIVVPPPILLENGIISSTLYYTASSGQTVFSLGTPDEFYNIGELTVDQANIYRSGNRLTLTDGYTLDIPSNTVTLAYPAGAGEAIIIELTVPPPPPAVLTSMTIKTENLVITTLNTIPDLSFVPNGSMTMLFVNGTTFFPPTSFTVSGKTLTWVSTIFSVPVGAAVIAVYTHV